MKKSWHKFDNIHQSTRKLPKSGQMVLVFARHAEFSTYGHCIAIGYLKYYAGDTSSPYFVTHGIRLGEVVGWRSMRGADQAAKDLYESARKELGIE